jgi:hypothetical protein
VECLKRYSTKSMDLRPGSTFFLEQIHGRAICVWQEKLAVKLVFYPELSPAAGGGGGVLAVCS